MAEHQRNHLHENRARALSFGSVAALYDAARPSYPPALIDDLMAFAPRQVLDVGCGTGKAARLLVERGCDLLGIEPDPSMAAVARSHGIRAEESTFEAWNPRGRTYDLIVSGQAWHWVNPEFGVPKAASLLPPGGHIGVFWNRGRPEDETRRALEAVYLRLAPELAKTNVALNLSAEPDDRYAEFRNAGLFTDVEARTYPWDAVYDRAAWIDLTATQSDHVRLPEERRHALLLALGDAIDALGGRLTYHYSTLLVLATRSV